MVAITRRSTQMRRANLRASLKLAIGGIGSVVFGLFVGGLILGLIATRFMGYSVATIQSFSMEPTLHRGDLIVSRPASIGEAKPGNIILFEEGTTTKLLVAHRVYSVVPVTTIITNAKTGTTVTQHSTLLRTKGDANGEVDAQVVDGSNFRGELLFTIPSAGLIFDHIPLQYVSCGAVRDQRNGMGSVRMGQVASQARAWNGARCGTLRDRLKLDGPLGGAF